MEQSENFDVKELDAKQSVEKLSEESEKAGQTFVYVKTGLGKRYGITVRPKNARPIMVAVHL